MMQCTYGESRALFPNLKKSKECELMMQLFYKQLCALSVKRKQLKECERNG